MDLIAVPPSSYPCFKTLSYSLHTWWAKPSKQFHGHRCILWASFMTWRRFLPGVSDVWGSVTKNVTGDEILWNKAIWKSIHGVYIMNLWTRSEIAKSNFRPAVMNTYFEVRFGFGFVTKYTINVNQRITACTWTDPHRVGMGYMKGKKFVYLCTLYTDLALC